MDITPLQELVLSAIALLLTAFLFVVVLTRYRASR